MMKNELCFRHVHLDFHTSEALSEVAVDFDPEAFAETLADAHVNSINLFARCHHGWLYYNSKKFPERIHPNLVNKNLLKQQIDACRSRGIRTPIYVPVQWDHYTAEHHPEWLTITNEGRQEGTPPYEAGFYRSICLNTPYVEFIREHVAELLDQFEVDGFFFDIVSPKDCSCRFCRQEMLDAGLDPDDPAQRKQHGRQVINRFKQEMTEFVRKRSQGCSVFYNSGHVSVRHRNMTHAYSHLELESLAGGEWGHMHFLVTSRYARTLGLDCLGMTGKFHTAWGDFHSFKTSAMLDYECFRMLALNAKCCIGDQLHPRGSLCGATYRQIGRTYAEIEKKEPWCKGAVPVVDIGVMTPDEWDERHLKEGLHPSILGVSRMLQEGGHQFDIIDSQQDFSKYKLIILPDNIPVSEELADRIETYLDAGGAVIASFESGLDRGKKQFSSSAFGVSLLDDGPMDRTGELARGKWYKAHDYVDYVVPEGPLGQGLESIEHVMYLRGTSIRAGEGSETLMNAVAPYFDRNFQHFCSHLQSPSSGRAYQPAVVRTGNLIYFCHPIFTTYEVNAPFWCKRLLLNAVDMLLPDPLVRHNGPSSLLVTLNEQTELNRQVLHVLNYIPEQRSQKIAVVEDVMPFHNLEVSLLCDQEIKNIQTVPDGEELPFAVKDGRVEFVIPKVQGHQMVCVESSIDFSK